MENPNLISVGEKRRESWDGEAMRRKLCEKILSQRLLKDTEIVRMKLEHKTRLNELKLTEEREDRRMRLEEERENKLKLQELVKTRQRDKSADRLKKQELNLTRTEIIDAYLRSRY